MISEAIRTVFTFSAVTDSEHLLFYSLPMRHNEGSFLILQMSSLCAFSNILNLEEGLSFLLLLLICVILSLLVDKPQRTYRRTTV